MERLAQPTKTCPHCATTFEIAPEDEAFYTRIDVPAPTLCYQCRRQRKLAQRNERNLYKRTCDLCHKEMIAVFPQETQYTIYCNKCWYGDKWDPFAFGREPDFTRPFFDQFAEMLREIPQFALFQDGTSENCDYTNYGLSNKNCYMAIGAWSEDCYYGSSFIKCKDCVDCMVQECELCYECFNCLKCYNLNFGKDCQNCTDSQFLEDCTSCKNCFCCAGLRHKTYCFENEQLTREEYEKRIASLTPLTPALIKTSLQNLDAFACKTPKLFEHGTNNENCTGDYNKNCKNCQTCFDCIQLEDSKYCEFSGVQSRNIYDCAMTGVACELCYELNGITQANNSKFLFYGRALPNCEYCQFCYSSDNLFGCIGLGHKRYCILNKQYSPEEYERLRALLITHMRATKEYGEFFPIEISRHPYKESVAQDYYPR